MTPERKADVALYLALVAVSSCSNSPDEASVEAVKRLAARLGYHEPKLYATVSSVISPALTELEDTPRTMGAEDELQKVAKEPECGCGGVLVPDIGCYVCDRCGRVEGPCR